LPWVTPDPLAINRFVRAGVLILENLALQQQLEV
jgi:hypothetical protein